MLSVLREKAEREQSYLGGFLRTTLQLLSPDRATKDKIKVSPEDVLHYVQASGDTFKKFREQII